MDFTLAIPAIIGVAPYSIFVVTIANDQVDINDVATNRQVTETRILLADGYRDYAGGDGYLNPFIVQSEGNQLVLSHGQLTANTLKMGPLVPPYFWNDFAGGTDSAVFQPSIGSNNNLQVFVQIRGHELTLNGNFFEVKEIVIDTLMGLSYHVMLEATASNPLL
jgi:hypothetical protein